jgi:hypothetical protein
MSTYSLAKGVLMTGVVLVAAWASAQPATQEQAVTRTAHDPQLQWGPCPAFMPAGCSLSVLHGDPANLTPTYSYASRPTPPSQSTGTRRPSA